MPDSPSLDAEFIRISRHQLRERLRRIELCVNQLSDGQLWARAHENENAVGNLILHLAGNIRQWLVTSFSNEPYNRNRDAEFAQREPMDRAETLDQLRQAIEDADQALAGVSADDLAAKRKIQAFEVTGLHAIYHAVEHLAEHTGQIIWITKRLTGEDLKIYGYLDDAGEQDRRALMP